MKKKFENYLIRKLNRDKMFSEGEIDQEKKTISLGLFGMKEHFLSHREKFLISILVKWYGYKLIEVRYKVQTTFLGETFETII